MIPTYTGDFSSAEDVRKQFEISQEDLKDTEVLLAQYETGNYEGSAYVLFRRDGRLYDVEGSHCSCNGLEDQWVPVETCIEKIEQDLSTKTRWREEYGDPHTAEQLRVIIGELKRAARDGQ